MNLDADYVQAVHIFPLKSAQEATINGELPLSLPVGPTGFEVNGVRDRDFVIVEGEGPEVRRMISQRGWNRAKHTITVGDKILATVGVDIQYDHLLVAAPGFGQHEISLETLQGKDTTEAEIHAKILPAIDIGDETAAYFTHMLGRAVRVVRSNRHQPRLLPQEYWEENASNQVAGADGFPFLLTSQESLNYLHYINGIPLGTYDLSYFRANIEIVGESFGSFREDFLRMLQIGKMLAYVVKACERCPIPNINQQTGERTSAANKLLTATRRGWIDGAAADDKPMQLFGQNLNHAYSQFEPMVISVGDEVTALEEADAPNFILKSSVKNEIG